MAGNVQYLTLVRTRRNPTRLRQWNATIGSGDDLKLAVTLYDQDTDPAPLNVSAGFWRMAFWRDDPRSSWCGRSWDYGWPYFGGSPGIAPGSISASGTVVAGVGGRMNLLIPASTTVTMLGRYRFSLQMQIPGGVSSDMEGELTVLPSAGLTPIVYGPFTLGVSYLGGGSVMGIGGVDSDGFPLT